MFGDLAPKLHAKGWRWLTPIMQGQKRPAVDAWQRFGPNPMNTAQTASMARTFRHCGVGLVYANDVVVAVDIDVLDPGKAMDAAMLTMSILGNTPLVRFGKAPKSLLVFKAAPGLQINGKGFGRFEFYWGSGQTVFYGMHPDGYDYRWPDKSPLEVSPRELPAVTTMAAAKLIASLKELLGVPQGQNLNGTIQGAGFASDRSSGHVARIVPPLRSSADPLSKAAEIVSGAVEGDRYHTMMGCIIALVMMGYTDSEITSALFGVYLAKFAQDEMAARASPIISGLRWARSNTGPDRVVVGARFPANFGWKPRQC